MCLFAFISMRSLVSADRADEIFNICRSVFAIRVEPALTGVTTDVLSKWIWRHLARANFIPLRKVWLELLLPSVVVSSCEVHVRLYSCVLFELLQCLEIATAVDGLNEHVLVVIRSKQLDIFWDAVHLCLRKFHPVQVALLVVPAHFELCEVRVLRVSRANGDNLADQVRGAIRLEKSADVTSLEDLILVLKLGIDFLFLFVSRWFFSRSDLCVDLGKGFYHLVVVWLWACENFLIRVVKLEWGLPQFLWY